MDERTLDDVSLFLGDKLGAMEERLATLVGENSFTDNVDGGRRVATLLEDLLRVPGLARRAVASERYADHLVFESGGVAGAPAVVLVGHLDTVFPPGVFEGYRRDGDLARGPGVLDMKGGLVVVGFALRALAEVVGLDNLPSIRLAIVADEEVGSPEGQAIIRDAARGSDAALVFEAGRAGDAIITRRKGTGGMSAIAHGKAAHAGANHKDGANALWALARFVDRVQGLTDYAKGVTVNVGKITGGQGKNTVPDQGEALLDLRFDSVADAEVLVAAVRDAAAEAAASVPGTSIVLTGGVLRHPLERTRESAALMEAYGAQARASGLGADEAGLIGGGSDASTTSILGIASIDGLGPRGKGFHTVDEQIVLATLVPKAQALARFLLAHAQAHALRAKAARP